MSCYAKRSLAFGLAVVLWTVVASGEGAPPAASRNASAARTAHLVATLHSASGLWVAFSADGLRLVTAGSESARVWGARTLKPLSDEFRPASTIRAAALRGDGAQVLTVGGTEANLWNLRRDGRGGPLRIGLRHSGQVFYGCYSPDGSTVATCGEDKTARLWSSLDGSLKTTLHHDAIVKFAAFDPAGKKVLTWCDKSFGAVHVWDITKQQEAFSSIKHATCFDDRPFIPSAAFSPDGKLIVVMCDALGISIFDAMSGVVRWGQSPLERGDNHMLMSAAFSPDSKRILVVTSGDIQEYDAISGKRLRVMNGDGAENNGGFYDTSGDNACVLGRYYIDMRRLIDNTSVFSDDDLSMKDAPVLAFSNDGATMAAG